MSVRAPAESRLPIDDGCSFDYLGVKIEITRGRDGLLSDAVASCRTEAELVPNLVSGAGHESNWSFTEPPDQNRTRLIDALCRLEGFLTPLGLIGFDFRRLEWSWFREDEKGQQEQVVSTTLDFEANKIRRPALSGVELKALAVEALKGDSRALLTLSLFRTGEDSFQKYRYQDALRYFLLAIEHEFAGGKFKTADVAKRYLKETRLVASIERAHVYADYFVRAGDIKRETVHRILMTRSLSEVVDWLVTLRGYLFHQSIRRKETWHPSLHIPHKEEAILVRSILETVIAELVRGAR